MFNIICLALLVSCVTANPVKPSLVFTGSVPYYGIYGPLLMGTRTPGIYRMAYSATPQARSFLHPVIPEAQYTYEPIVRAVPQTYRARTGGNVEVVQVPFLHRGYVITY